MTLNSTVDGYGASNKCINFTGWTEAFDLSRLCGWKRHKNVPTADIFSSICHRWSGKESWNYVNFLMFRSRPLPSSFELKIILKRLILAEKVGICIWFEWSIKILTGTLNTESKQIGFFVRQYVGVNQFFWARAKLNVRKTKPLQVYLALVWIIFSE